MKKERTERRNNENEQEEENESIVKGKINKNEREESINEK